MEMKKILVAGLTSLALIMGAGSAMALSIVGGTYDGTDVGAIDTIFMSTYLANSGEQTELDWVNTVLGLSEENMYTSFIKDENLGEDWSNVASPDQSVTASNSGIWAYALASEPAPEYFLIKTGKLKNSTPDTLALNTLALNTLAHNTFLLTNVGNEGNIDWAVVDLAAMGIENITNIKKFSHLDEFGATPIPEPSVTILLGTCLACFAGLRLRRKKK